MSGKLARRDQHTDDTRRAILAAARQAFARDGYADTSLDAIVGRARLSKGALYHHFASKAAVLEAVYVEMEQELAGAVHTAAMAAGGSAWARMAAAIDAFFTASAEPAYARIVLRDAPLVLGPDRGRQLDQAIGLGLVIELLAALHAEGGLRAAIPSGTAVLFALLDGLRAPAPDDAGADGRQAAPRLDMPGSR
jgi:AcrR family transcriptional regulator